MATQEFDASVELIDALTRASERWSDAFGERYRDCLLYTSDAADE